MLFGYL